MNPKTPWIRGYSTNEHGDVVLTMSPEDWNMLLITLGYATGRAHRDGDVYQANRMIALVNRLNEGNANFRPYEVDPFSANPASASE